MPAGGKIGNKGGGRKPIQKELDLVRMYEGLAPRAFEIISEALHSKTKADRRWAMDWLKSGLVKLLPQVTKVGGDENNRTPIPISNIFMNAVQDNHSHEKDSQADKTD